MGKATRQVTILEHVAESIAEISFFIESKGCLTQLKSL